MSHEPVILACPGTRLQNMTSPRSPATNREQRHQQELGARNRRQWGRTKVVKTDEPEPVEAPDTNHRKQPPLLLPPEVQRYQETPTTRKTLTGTTNTPTSIPQPLLFG
ncbi:hypothetical protein Bca52824_078995 [Brassica carinata]|uniref:Uncharacterized protein n=1 Tax=Brassica carinata TaxID=52824 RepID=A0A8X7U1I2_BRACI|nr:hypothetical protein Bca52824_078995 [Brassica carinata]